MAAWRTLQDLLLDFSTENKAVAVIALGEAQASRTTFAQLRDGTMRIAGSLVARGLAPGATVGVMGTNSVGWIEAFLGIIAAGCAAMPVDVQAGDDKLRRMLSIAECRLVLAGAEQTARLDGLGVELAPFTPPPTALLETDEAIIARRRGPEDEAVLVFTSGTTGTPKPVVLTHANLISNVVALRTEKIVSAGDHALLPLPLHHVYPLTVGMLTVLASGASIILPEGLSGPQLVEAMRDGEASAMLGVPRLYSVLLVSLHAAIARRKGPAARLFAALLALATFAQRRLGVRLGSVLFQGVRAQIGPKLRLMVSGGAALPLADEWALRALGWNVLTGYGLTETSPILTFNRPAHPRIGTVGQALPGVRLRIATPDPDGIGEIQAMGASVFPGYRHDEAATRAAFTPDGWFRTGDLGRVDANGYLRVAGRATETIILPNGKKIDPETLETSIPRIR